MADQDDTRDADEARQPAGAGDASGAEGTVGPDAATGWIGVPGGSRARADEWALVLASQNIAVRIQPDDRGYGLAVRAGDLARARTALDSYEVENSAARRETTLREDQPPLAEPGQAGVVLVIVLIAGYVLSQRASLHDFVYSQGSAHARSILSGEVWRTVSALFLHADLAHVIGNALFGVYFVTAVTRLLGTGLGLMLVLAAGALGNGMNALAHPGGHESIGASTAVFGAIGLLAGIALARRNRSGMRGARLLLPIGAGLGLLAMLGTGDADTDFFAHVYGLLSGGLLGVAVQLALPRRPGATAQIVLGLCALALVGLSFWLAWGTTWTLA